MLDKPTWIGRGSRLQLTGGFGMTLDAPYAYFINTESRAPLEPAAVNLRLPIGNCANVAAGTSLPYWPKYADLSPAQRRCYLDWLASGRQTVPAELGYTYLYFYGLERRLLVDRQDIRDTFNAVLRLIDLYATAADVPPRSVPYAAALAWHVLVRDAAIFTTADLAILVPQYLLINTEDAMAAVLSFWITKSEPLAEWVAFVVAQSLPKSQRSVVTQRAGEELRQLFRRRYAEQYGNGLTLQPSKRAKRFSYRPANRVLEVSEVIAFNPAGLMSQFDDVAELWNGCVADLKRLSTLKVSDDAEAVDVWRATPAELRQTVDHPLVDAFAAFVAAHTGDSGDVQVTPRAVAGVIGIAPDAKLTLSTSRRIVEATQEAGYCLEPDARLTNCAYDDDEPVVLFLNLSDAPLDAGKYMAASVMLNVGFAVASADGTADETELTLLTQQLEASFSLNDTEQRRLEALRTLRASHGVELSDMARTLRELNHEQQELIGRLMLALVAADGQVTKSELKMVRRVYAAMGWGKAAVNAAVASLLPTPSGHCDDDDLATVLPATAGAAGEVIPPQPSAMPAFTLNRTAIASILQETQDVAKLLADAMAADVVDAPQPTTSPAWSFVPPAATPPQVLSNPPDSATPTSSVQATAVPGLPERYTEFYRRLIGQSSWPRDALADLSRSHGLMPSGALETINDWSTETHGGPLLYEDGDTITLETAYLTQN